MERAGEPGVISGNEGINNNHGGRKKEPRADSLLISPYYC